MNFLRNLFRTNRTPDQVLDILISLLDKTISDGEWDSFLSVKIINSDLEKIRLHVEKMWVEDSPYMIKGSIDPTDLNSKGVEKIKQLIVIVKSNRSGSLII